MCYNLSENIPLECNCMLLQRLAHTLPSELDKNLQDALSQWLY